NISDEWTLHNEGGETWSVFDVIGHLIHGEKTDWIPRIEIILSENPNKTFVSFNRFAQFQESNGKTLPQLLDEFKQLRQQNLEFFNQKNISIKELELKGIHPVFGKVTLSELISTWTVHDLNHLAQISRIMAKQYKNEVGPWLEYLRILK
uniref:DinB family protein n=1 Tax=Yeosuana marina TaxID=1565536 RepID=UPI0030C7F098